VCGRPRSRSVVNARPRADFQHVVAQFHALQRPGPQRPQPFDEKSVAQTLEKGSANEAYEAIGRLIGYSNRQLPFWNAGSGRIPRRNRPPSPAKNCFMSAPFKRWSGSARNGLANC
jgi:hypothetical protein